MSKLLSLLLKNKPYLKKHNRQIKTLSYSTNQQPELHQSLAQISSNPWFPLLGICNNINTLKKVHSLFIVHGLIGNLLCDTKLVSLYGSFGDVSNARLLFDQIPNPDFYSHKVMIRWYFLNEMYDDVIGFYNQSNVHEKSYDHVLFSIVLKACCELRDVDEGRKVHCQIVKVGIFDSFMFTSLVDVYAKCGEIECSRKVFDEFPDRNVVSWTSMIVGYVQNDCAKEGLILFNRMREELVDSNQFTLGALVTACAKLGYLHQGKWFYGYVIKSGIELNSHLMTTIMDMYIKCGDIRHARFIFDEANMIDLVSWTAMIVGYSHRGYPNEALKLFTDKKWVDILPNVVTIASVLSACAQSGNLNCGKSIHSLVVKLCLENSTVINALIDMYAKCGMITEAHYIFEAVSDRNVIAWNSIVSGYSQNGFAYKALELFNQMKLESVVDAISVVLGFSACGSIGDLQLGSSLHAFSIKEGFLSSNIYVGTALLNFYAKCGDAESARFVFDNMRERNTVTWSAMISGCGMQGDSIGSLTLFNDMLKEKIIPNEVIFTTILTACSHTGMVGEGGKYFNSMFKDYNFIPSMKHYTCMVDLLARAGRLEEAWDFIQNMPVEPDVSLFGAFLHGCELYSRFDLGEMAIQRMLECHPDEACYFVLISNLYASDGRWSQVNQVREMMKQKGLSKSPGCSYTDTDMNNVNFSFSRAASLG